MGLLNGDIAAEFGAVFGGLYLDAKLFRQALTADGSGGWTAGAIAHHNIKVQEDDLSEVARAAAGYTAKDSRFLVLTNSVPVSFPLDTDWKIAFNGLVYSINPAVSLDPAKSHFVLKATRTSESVPVFV